MTIMEIVKVEAVQLLKAPPTEDQLLQRRIKTAERVRRYRERKRFQRLCQTLSSTSHTPEWFPEQRIKATESVRKYRQRKSLGKVSSGPSTEKYISQFREAVEVSEEEIEDKSNIINQIQPSKEQDPLELVKVHLSVDENTRSIPQISRIEEIIIGVDESATNPGPTFGPTIHGISYCVKKKNESSPHKSDRVDSTNFVAERGEIIFKRQCTESHCRGCVVEVISPVERFEVPHRNLLRCVSSYYTKVAVLNIAGQKSLPEATFNLLCTLTPDDLGITLQQFTRMWRSFLLRRVQDVQSKSTCTRVPNTIPLDCTGVLVPAPLGDLLTSIGRFHSTATGVMHHTYAPAISSRDPVDWWTLDDSVVTSWIRTMNMFKDKFMMREMPPATDFDNKPLMMTQIEVTCQRMVQCRAKTTEIALTDGYVHMVNDPLYSPGIYDFEDCHLIVSSMINQDYLRMEYLSSFIIQEEICY